MPVLSSVKDLPHLFTREFAEEPICANSMGSGSSKKHRPSSTSAITANHVNSNNANKSSSTNARSMSYPSYLSSIQKQHKPTKNQVYKAFIIVFLNLVLFIFSGHCLIYSPVATYTNPFAFWLPNGGSKPDNIPFLCIGFFQRISQLLLQQIA